MSTNRAAMSDRRPTTAFSRGELMLGSNSRAFLKQFSTEAGNCLLLFRKSGQALLAQLRNDRGVTVGNFGDVELH
jgi:hypothetical protein